MSGNEPFKLRVPTDLIAALCQRYANPQHLDQEVEQSIAPAVRRQRFYTKAQFLTVCRWKSTRTQKWAAENEAKTVEIVSRAALSSEDERARIETFTLLRGVDWPTASTLLHFGHTDPYPILDVRALWSLSVDPPPPYTFELWTSYVDECRRLSIERNISVRELDMALWQFSKEQQPKRVRKGS